MTIFSQCQRRTIAHPPWCDVPRCLTGLNKLGEHRSTPLTLPGLPVVTLMQRQDGPPYAEVRRRVRLVEVAGDGGRTHAAALAVAVSEAIDASMPSGDHGQYSDHDATSTGGQ